uniref:TIDP3108 n=1 Tax=Arundo donax TaxID=35708 RepID=A0A0A8YQU2_ARUDO
MRPDDRFAVLRSIGKECIHEDELRLLLKKKTDPTCYIWFEPSPMMDIEQGIMKTIYVNKMVTAGCTVKILMADWFLQRHPKIGSNLNKIRAIGCYNIAMWKAAGMYLDRVEVVWLSDELNHHAGDYWPLAMDVARKYTMKRMARYCVYTVPYGPERLPAAEIIYPCMQVAAVLCQKLQVDIWLFSMDQREIILLAKDYCEDINRENRSTILLHCMLPNLLEDPEFQDERDPGRTIFMLDEEDDVNEKIISAFCPPKESVRNPCLEYIKSVVLPWFGKFEVVQKEGNGSNKTYSSMEELNVDYESGDLDSSDLKLAFGKAINEILEVVGEYFRSNTEAQALITARKFQNQITADIRKIQMQNKEMFDF